MAVILALALMGAVLIPVMLVAIRHEVRLRRIRLIHAMEENLNLAPQTAAAGPTRGGATLDSTTPSTEIPSFEFVKSKYAVDLDPPPKPLNPRALRALDFNSPGIEKHISDLRWWELRSNWSLLTAAIPYVLVCTAGFVAIALLFHQPGTFAICLDRTLSCDAGSRSLLSVRTDTPQFKVFVAAFLGAFTFTIRVFIRSVAVFDLSAITVFRAAAHIALNTAMASLIYVALPDLGAVSQGTTNPAPPPAAFNGLWLALAFTFGFVPDAGLVHILSKVAPYAGLMKTIDQRFATEIRAMPLDVIDGIDFYIRFRLEEANISEVQSLACANPLMLFIETPYGLYQVIDWVSQAQLCIVVGLERFLMLRQFNIRTIFDLERAVLSDTTTPELQRIIGGILIADTGEAKQLAHYGGRRFALLGPGAAARVEFAAFSDRVAQDFAANHDAGGRNQTLEHLVRITLDDLHIHRLRQIWLKIGERIGRESEYFGDTKARQGGRA